MRCLVVDDELVARRGMIKQLEKINTLEVVGEANCMDAFIAANDKYKPDLIFLDIMLRNHNIMDYLSKGIELPMVVFVSAYSHYALTGFDLKAVDYLLKPVSDDRLHQCIERAQHLFYTKNFNSPTYSESIYVKSNGKYYRVYPSDILFVKSMENYVLIFMDNKKLVCKLTMEQMSRLLPSYVFLQVHRSYLVNIKKIDFIEKLNITIHNETIPISRDKRKEIYHKLMGMTIKIENDYF